MTAPSSAEKRDALNDLTDPYLTDGHVDKMARFVLRDLEPADRQDRILEIRRLAGIAQALDTGQGNPAETTTRRPWEDADDHRSRAVVRARWVLTVAIEAAVLAERLAAWPAPMAVTS